jgi:hypothetical protein
VISPIVGQYYRAKNCRARWPSASVQQCYLTKKSYSSSMRPKQGLRHLQQTHDAILAHTNATEGDERRN